MTEFVTHREVTLTVNQVAHKAEVEARLTLADFLRENLRLTGTHLGCEIGRCGTCTVLLNGQAVRSCLVFTVQADEADVTTIEGLDHDGVLHALQESFSEHHALQCGFCTPGMILAAYDLLQRHSHVDEDLVRADLAGNLCRCTGYETIIDAVLASSTKPV